MVKNIIGILIISGLAGLFFGYPLGFLAIPVVLIEFYDFCKDEDRFAEECKIARLKEEKQYAINLKRYRQQERRDQKADRLLFEELL